jgi:hypothetical protein
MTDFTKLMSSKSPLFAVMNDTARISGDHERELAAEKHGRAGYDYYEDEESEDQQPQPKVYVDQAKPKSDSTNYWTMTGGKKILISEMTDSHLRNTINCLIRPNGLQRCRQHPIFQALESEYKKRGFSC